MIQLLKKFILFTLAAGIPFANAYIFLDSCASTLNFALFIFITVFFTVIVIPVLALISIFLPRNRILSPKELRHYLALSFVIWVLCLSFYKVKDYDCLKSQNETVSFLREQKFLTGRYPDKLDLPQGEQYYPEDDGQNFVLIKNIDDTSYQYCSKPDSTACQVPQGSRIRHRFIDGWLVVEYCD